MKKVLAALFVVLPLAAGPAEALEDFEAPFEISGFGLERMRKDISGATNKVTAYFTLAAAEGVELHDLRAQIEYTDYKGKELKKSPYVRIGNIRPGERSRAKASAIFVPIFNGYVIRVTGSANGRRASWEFYGASGVAQPFFLPSKPIPGIAFPVAMAHELEQSSRRAGARLYIRVRNLGALEVRKARATVQLINKKGRPFGSRVTATLSGARGGRPGILDGGEERLFVMRFRRFPEFASFSVELDWERNEEGPPLGGRGFLGTKEVELAHFEFEPSGDGLGIRGRARNGLDRPVENLRITLRLLRKKEDPKKRKGKEGGVGEIPMEVVRTLKHVVPGRIEPEKTAPFSFTAEGVGEFHDFNYDVAYDEPGKEEPSTPKPVGQAAIRVDEAVRKPDGTVAIAGEVTNTGGAGIRAIEITFSFLRKADGGEGKVVKKHLHLVPRVVGAGGSAPFRFKVAECPEFDEYFFEVNYEPENGAGPK
jgi:hypothetical protein